MKTRTLVSLGLVAALLVSLPAEAHFKLDQPADWIVTNASGDPQKDGPCGSTAAAQTNVVTKVVAGSKLHIKITETIRHGGHYRVALAADRTKLVDPMTVVQNNNCVSATIQQTPVLPVLADGLFPHADGPNSPAPVWETDVTVPETPCPSCTLQVMQFMTPHAPGCWYYHCANVEIVPKGTDIGDGGVVVIDGGSSGGSSGGPAAGETTSGADDGGAGTDSAGTGRRLQQVGGDDGCSIGVARRGAPLFLAGALGVVCAFALVRRRRARR